MGTKKQKQMSREDRLDQIASLFLLAGEGVELTPNDVGKVLGMANSTHLVGMLSDLVEMGYLSMRKIPHRANIEKKMYTITDQALFATRVSRLRVQVSNWS